VRKLTDNMKGMLRRLLNGPWPCRFTRGLIADQSEHRGEYNGQRAAGALVKLRLVERYTDPATDEDNWRIRLNRFGQPVLWYEGDIDRIRHNGRTYTFRR
jgi:hypothetical protein